MCTTWWKNLWTKPVIKPPMISSNKVALLFGINDYPGSVNDLDFCVKDIEDWEYKLKMNWPEIEIRKFLDSEATVARYIAEVQNAINAMPVGSTIVLFSDCCYSGDNTKAFNNPCRRKTRFMPTDLPPRSVVGGRVAHPRVAPMNWLAISTSAENQPSEEAVFSDGSGNGIGTYYAVRSVGKGVTWKAFYDNIRAYLPNTMFEQIPQMDGPELLQYREMFAGPTLFIANSTHGTYVYDKNGDEDDGYDEAICFHDGNLVDDDLNAILQSIKPITL